MSTPPLQVAREAYGDSFVAYVLNTDAVLLDQLEPTAEQRNCLEFLEHFGGHVLAGKSEFERDIHRPTILGPIPDVPSEGLATRMRETCGGQLPDIASADPVESSLLACVRDMFPVLLLPPRSERYHFGHFDFGAALLRFGGQDKFLLSVLRDPDLARLFPGAPSPDSLEGEPLGRLLEISSYAVWLSGSGGGLQLAFLPDALVGYALSTAILAGPPTMDACLQHARDGLSTARALARGEKIRTPVVVGLSDLRLAETHETIEVSTGRLAKPNEAALARLGRKGVSGRPIEAILTLSAYEQLLDVGPSTSGEAGQTALNPLFERQQQRMSQARQELERGINLFRLGLLLASDDDSPIAPVPEITTQLSPLKNGSSAALGPHSPARAYVDVTLTPETSSRVQIWWERVLASHPPSLDIGMRRLISATTVRVDPMDGFIDAVMAWENMFGETQDTALKVCGSLARLLEPDDADKREQLYRRLKKLYGIRSGLVHGASEPDIQTARKHHEEAVRVALAAMRKAYEVPGILQLKKSVERYELVLLGLGPTIPPSGSTAVTGLSRRPESDAV